MGRRRLGEGDGKEDRGMGGRREGLRE